ncbi:hypothetical protein QE152_g17928 [Popillia japonica]|uniref:Uncharacterized protein n=1 Tax=Popillia japonica TaxID=7064 RepID=A0AAW1L1C6_POPJA
MKRPPNRRRRKEIRTSTRRELNRCEAHISLANAAFFACISGTSWTVAKNVNETRELRRSRLGVRPPNTGTVMDIINCDHVLRRQVSQRHKKCQLFL